MPPYPDTEGEREREPEDPQTKEPTYRLCKGIVPEDSGCRIVVLAAVNNHHHWERQGLEDRGLDTPLVTFAPSFSIWFPDQHCAFLQVSVLN